ncbi:MAG: hypothetical protein LBP21_10090 [Synergistaceae bacterium]|jgi:hypothetical protein|nr:hypothetical protein [Synergistaceae bacterium]
MQELQNNINAVARKQKNFSPLYIAFFLLLYVFLPAFTLSVFLLLQIGAPVLAYWLSVALQTGIVFYCYYRKKIGVREILVFLFLLLFSHAVAYYIFDTFHDGLAYHQPAVRRIAEGFNPIYDGYMYLERPMDHWNEQATYFPKATWYFAATLTAALGDLQLGTVYHSLLFFAALLFAWGVTEGESFSRRMLWGIGCLNPIALTQFTGYVVDGALASLTMIAIIYAYHFFCSKAISRLVHFFCVVSLSVLFCIKSTGFVYGSIVLFCVALHHFVKTYRETQSSTFAKRSVAASKAAFSLGVKLGIPVFLLVFVLGFAPYVTNLLNHKHIFYPLIQNSSEDQASEKGRKVGPVRFSLEKIAEMIYPHAHNRFTRLLFSTISHTQDANTMQPARVKNPFDITGKDWSDWKVFEQADNIRVAGLGPLFFLILLVSFLYLLAFRLHGNRWLLLMLMILLFIQPYGWQMRYIPFLWFFPFVCLLSVPEKRCYFLGIPFSLAIVNSLGVLYLFASSQWGLSQEIAQIIRPHSGEPVLLDRSVFEYNGIFDRFAIRQKYANPEETDFYRLNVELGSLSRGRTSTGTNISFMEDLLPVPETRLVFAQEAALPWLKMSEGLMPVEVSSGLPSRLEWRTYADKVKFYMSLDRKPESDWELLLDGAAFDDTHPVPRELSVLVFVNNEKIGTWKIGHDFKRESFPIPQQLMEKSFHDDMRLVTLMLRLPDVLSLLENQLEVSTYGLRLTGMQMRPK